MKPLPLEKDIVKDILTYLNSLEGCRAIKRHGGRLRGGEPDITGCYQGQHLEFEVKRSSKEEATPRQGSNLRKWKAAGAIIGVVYSKKQVVDIMLEVQTLNFKYGKE